MKAKILFLAILLALFSGCAEEKEGGDLTIAGSTTVQPIITKAAEVYAEEHPGTLIGVQGGGSGTGIRMVGEGSVALGASSRELSAQEKEEHPGLLTHAIAIDSLAIVVHPSNNLTGLSLQQIKDLFLGKIKNFRELGGPDRPVVLVIREDGSGTRATFDSMVLDGSEASDASLQKPASGAIRFTVSNNPNAIAYIGIGYVDESVKALSVDGFYPGEENIRTGAYSLSRSLYLVTDNEPEGPAKDFLDYVLSEEGQRIVKEEGFIAVK